MLRFTFFNVGHGDSIVLEKTGDTPTFAVVDCNMNLSAGHVSPPALDYLRQRGATRLETVILTHLHRDHYTGIELILNAFPVGTFIIPPFLSRNSGIHNKQLKRTGEKLRQLLASTSEPIVCRPALSLACVLKYITNHEDLVEEATGRANHRTLCGVPAIVHLPLPNIKGALHHKIEFADSPLDAFSEMNDASIAVTVEFAGHRVLLTGDATLSQWNEHQRQLKREGVTGLRVDALKVPHHGSRHNNTPVVYSYFFDTTRSAERLSIISANGRTHPHDEYFSLIREFDLQPYCTNLAEQCRPPNVRRFFSLTALPAASRPFIDNYDIETVPVACQGDITLEISEDGAREIKTSVGLPCVYRAK